MNEKEKNEVKKCDFLTLRRVPKQDKPIYQRVSGYLYGLGMPGNYQLPLGVYLEKAGARKKCHVIDLLTGLEWDAADTLAKAHCVVADRVVLYAFTLLSKQPRNVIPENRALYEALLAVGEFVRPLELKPLRPENIPPSCITFDSEGVTRA